MTLKENTIDDNNRILIIDDNPAIHTDFDKILGVDYSKEYEAEKILEKLIFSESDNENNQSANIEYHLTHASQGEEAYKLVAEAEKNNEPFALLFVDVRMPPGWDGIETIKRIWANYPNNEMVICTAYSDYSWDEIINELGSSDQLHFLRKPFDIVSVKQMALAAVKKWNLSRQVRHYVDDLEKEVAARTQELNDKVDELQKALDEIKELREIVPMCSWCHKIRDDDNYWQKVDDYIRAHTSSRISHSICPDCFKEHFGRPPSK